MTATTTNAEAEDVKRSGNRAFVEKRFTEAEGLYSKAIEIDPSQHTAFGNRSAARFQLQKYEAALQDAMTSIQLCPSWPKVCDISSVRIAP